MNVKDIAILSVIAGMVVITVWVIQNERVPAEILYSVPVAAPTPHQNGSAVTNPVFGASDFSPITIGRPEPSSVPAAPAIAPSAASSPAILNLPRQAEEATESVSAPSDAESFGTGMRSASVFAGSTGKSASSAAAPSGSVVFTSETASPSAESPQSSQNNIFGGSSLMKLKRSGGGFALKTSTNPSSTDAENKIQFETNSGASSAAPAGASE